MKLAVVVALWDERESIVPLLDALTQTLAAQPSWRWEVILVIEGEDGTYERATEYAKTERRIRVLYQPRPSGLGAAFRRGFAQIAPDADLVATMDGDLNHGAAELPRLIEALQLRGADVLIGSRRVRGGGSRGVPWWKKEISYGITQLLSPLLPRGIHDPTSGYRIYRAAALKQIRYAADGFSFLPEMLVEAVRLKMKLAEEPITYTYRKHGTSKMKLGPTGISYLQFVTRGVGKAVLSALGRPRSGHCADATRANRPADDTSTARGSPAAAPKETPGDSFPRDFP